MTDQNLRELLEKLHAELEHVDDIDEPGREMLRHLESDIREMLKRSGTRVAADEPMLERWQESIDHFEVTHPTLTMALSEIMTILSNAGI